MKTFVYMMLVAVCAATAAPMADSREGEFKGDDDRRRGDDDRRDGP